MPLRLAALESLRLLLSSLIPHYQGAAMKSGHRVYRAPPDTLQQSHSWADNWQCPETWNVKIVPSSDFCRTNYFSSNAAASQQKKTTSNQTYNYMFFSLLFYQCMNLFQHLSLCFKFNLLLVLLDRANVNINYLMIRKGRAIILLNFCPWAMGHVQAWAFWFLPKLSFGIFQQTWPPQSLLLLRRYSLINI